MRYILLLPSLSVGEHKIVWKYTFAADLSDDLLDYPNGMTGEVTSVLNVQWLIHALENLTGMDMVF